MMEQLARELDEATVRRHVEQKLTSARRVDEPAPHLLVNDFFDPSFRCRTW